jgi:hypothetical protein
MSSSSPPPSHYFERFQAGLVLVFDARDAVAGVPDILREGVVALLQRNTESTNRFVHALFHRISTILNHREAAALDALENMRDAFASVLVKEYSHFAVAERPDQVTEWLWYQNRSTLLELLIWGLVDARVTYDRRPGNANQAPDGKSLDTPLQRFAAEAQRCAFDQWDRIHSTFSEKSAAHVQHAQPLLDTFYSFPLL